MKISSIAIVCCAVPTVLSALVLSGSIDLTSLFNYQSQPIPNYITNNNTGNNPTSNATATLGRVLFYDKNLSTDNSVSCASCHKQELAFGDSAAVSEGVNGVTGRHSMRLINARFGDEVRFFWDERAVTLEEQVTQPIKDHAEMGFSGTNGAPSFQALITKMEGTPYYKSLFTMAFGDSTITEARMKIAIAQFIRSIQSFDSKFDAGLALVPNGNIGQRLAAQFPNFTAQENQGKALFLGAPQFQNPQPGQAPTGNRIGGGLGCQACHQAPEFSVDPNSQNNGVIAVANNPTGRDLNNRRSPTLRDMFSPAGTLNGPLMHDGSMETIDEVLNHYNDIPTFNANINNLLDIRLRGNNPGAPPGPGQNLLMTATERAAITAFLKTLTGSSVYTDERWSDPFGPEGQLTVLGNVEVNEIVVGEEFAEQRSSIDSVTVKFEGNVVVRPGAFTVMQRSTAEEPTFEIVTTTVSTPVFEGGETIVTILFEDHLRKSLGKKPLESLADGNYQIRLAGHLLLRNGIPMGTDMIFGNEEADGFFTLFGDTDGNRIIDKIDMAAFEATYGKSIYQKGYNAALDYDENGVIDKRDQTEFELRLKKTIPFDFD